MSSLYLATQGSYFSPRHVLDERPTAGLRHSCPMIVVDLRDDDLRKELRAFVVPQKEHVESMAMGADHSVTPLLAQLQHRQERRAPEILLRFRLVPAVEIRSVIDRETSVIGDDVVRFEHEQTGIDCVDGVPDPVVIPVHVE